MRRWVIALIAAVALVAAPSASPQVVLLPRVYHTAVLRSDSIRTFTVSCPPGYIAISAGISTPAPGVTTLSIRSVGLRGFTFSFGNSVTNPDQHVTVAVVCSKIGPPKAGRPAPLPILKVKPVKTKPVVVPANGGKLATLPCPKGTLPAGGGYDLAPSGKKSDSAAAFTGRPLSVPVQVDRLDGFSFVVVNSSETPRTAVLYGRCLTVVRPPGARRERLHVRQETNGTPVAPGRHVVTRACPRGWLGLATGYKLPPGLSLEGSTARPKGGRWWLRNATAAPVLANLQVVCGRLAP